MPQETNLNVAPYFDDFDPQSNYYKVLFKPAYPVQARELNNLQSILQNQIEDMGTHFFREGAKVIPGQLNYLPKFYGIQIDPESVTLQMRGACQGCPSSTATLKMGIENMLRHYIPEVREVRAAEM